LGSRVNTQKFFSFKFTFRCRQSDIVPIICSGVVDTGGKFATVINNTTPVVQAAKFAASVIDTGVAPDYQISPRIFEKIRNDPHVIFKGLGEEPKAKNLTTLFLQGRT
jgi:hypothetical protein